MAHVYDFTYMPTSETIYYRKKEMREDLRKENNVRARS